MLHGRAESRYVDDGLKYRGAMGAGESVDMLCAVDNGGCSEARGGPVGAGAHKRPPHFQLYRKNQWLPSNSVNFNRSPDDAPYLPGLDRPHA